jgi:hypothetical protein
MEDLVSLNVDKPLFRCREDGSYSPGDLDRRLVSVLNSNCVQRSKLDDGNLIWRDDNP